MFLDSQFCFQTERGGSPKNKQNKMNIGSVDCCSWKLEFLMNFEKKVLSKYIRLIKVVSNTIFEMIVTTFHDKPLVFSRPDI